MHIGLVIGDAFIGGMERQATLLAERLRQRGIAVTIILNRSALRNAAKKKRIQLPDVPVLKLYMQYFPRLSKRFAGHYLQKNGIDVLIAYNPGNAFDALEGAKRAGIPLLVNLRGLKFSKASADFEQLKAAVGYADGVISNTAVALDLAAARLSLDGKRTAVIPNGIERMRPLAQPHSGRFCVFFAGNLYAVKDPLTFVRIIENTIPAVPEISAEMFGSGVLDEEVRQYLKEHHLEERIQLRGYVASGEIPYEKADLLINCSMREASSNVIAEALIHGVPVIGTNVGGTPEMLNNRDFARMFSPGDVASGAAAVEEFAKMPLARRSGLAGAAAAFAQDRFSPDKMTDEYLQIVSEVLAQRGLA